MYPLYAFIASVLFFVAYKVIFSILRSRRESLEAAKLGCKPPSLIPSSLPFGIDHLRRAVQADNEKRFPDMLIERMAEQGVSTYQFHMMGNHMIHTDEPKNIQAMLATQFSDFSLGKVRRDVMFPLLGNGIFTQDGKDWEHSRVMMRPQFAREQISDLDMEERHVQNMMRAIPVDPKSGWTEQFDIQVLFFRLTLDAATEFLFGESADSQVSELPENKILRSKGNASAREESAFATAFDTSQTALAMRFRLQDKNWMYNTSSFRSANKVCHDFIDHYVQLALKGNMGDLKEKNSTGDIKKQKYIFLEALASETKDPIELRSQLINILLAGRDTTASLLGWTFYLLARHPAVWEKLRAVVIDEFGTYTNQTDISFARMKNCQYLQHTLNEVLRLYPLVPFNFRTATKNTTIPVGGGPDGKSPVFVREGQVVEYSVYVMQRRKDLWGQDADEFKPERWLGRKSGWEYLPFNGGPRICLGQQFALTEASFVVIRLLQRFDKIESLLDEDRARHNFTLTDCSASGVIVRLHEAGA